MVVHAHQLDIVDDFFLVMYVAHREVLEDVSALVYSCNEQTYVQSFLTVL